MKPPPDLKPRLKGLRNSVKSGGNKGFNKGWDKRFDIRRNFREVLKRMTMNTVLGITLLAAGALLIVLGINASSSFASDVSRTFSGSPTDRTIWLLVSG